MSLWPTSRPVLFLRDSLATGIALNWMWVNKIWRAPGLISYDSLTVSGNPRSAKLDVGRYFKPLQLQPFVQQEWLQGAWWVPSSLPDLKCSQLGPVLRRRGWWHGRLPRWNWRRQGLALQQSHWMLKHDENWRFEVWSRVLPTTQSTCCRS